MLSNDFIHRDDRFASFFVFFNYNLIQPAAQDVHLAAYVQNLKIIILLAIKVSGKIYMHYLWHMRVLQLTKVKRRAFSKPVPQPDRMRWINCADNSILYLHFVFMSIGSVTFKSKGSSDWWSVTSTSVKKMPMLYPTIVNVWSVNIALVIRLANLALHIVSRILMSLLQQSFQSSFIIVRISANFLQMIIESSIISSYEANHNKQIIYLAS